MPGDSDSAVRTDVADVRQPEPVAPAVSLRRLLHNVERITDQPTARETHADHGWVPESRERRPALR